MGFSLELKLAKLSGFTVATLIYVETQRNASAKGRKLPRADV